LVRITSPQLDLELLEIACRVLFPQQRFGGGDQPYPTVANEL
jgi:hypothetical protein